MSIWAWCVPAAPTEARGAVEIVEIGVRGSGIECRLIIFAMGKRERRGFVLGRMPSQMPPSFPDSAGRGLLPCALV